MVCRSDVSDTRDAVECSGYEFLFVRAEKSLVGSGMRELVLVYAEPDECEEQEQIDDGRRPAVFAIEYANYPSKYEAADVDRLEAMLAKLCNADQKRPAYSLRRNSGASHDSYGQPQWMRAVLLLAADQQFCESCLPRLQAAGIAVQRCGAAPWDNGDDDDDLDDDDDDEEDDGCLHTKSRR